MSINARYQPGELDQRVELQSPVRTDNGQGGNDISWQVEATVWAKVRPMSGGERSQADRLAAEGGYMVIVRNNGKGKEVTEDWRIRWVNEDRVLNIRHVKEAGQRDLYQPIECESGVAT